MQQAHPTKRQHLDLTSSTIGTPVKQRRLIDPMINPTGQTVGFVSSPGQSIYLSGLLGNTIWPTSVDETSHSNSHSNPSMNSPHPLYIT